jgi:hypothetical protein
MRIAPATVASVPAPLTAPDVPAGTRWRVRTDHGTPPKARPISVAQVSAVVAAMVAAAPVSRASRPVS